MTTMARLSFWGRPKRRHARDVEDLSKRDGFELRESGTRYRPYERAWFTVAVIDKIGRARVEGFQGADT